jgi:hypothetical protein
MKTYILDATGETFTLDEIKDDFEKAWELKDQYESFEEYLEAMIKRGDFIEE